MTDEKVPQHKSETKNGFDPLPSDVDELEPDFDVDETDEVDETVEDIPETELEDAATDKDEEESL